MNTGAEASVAITRCDTYDQTQVTAAVRQAVEYLGGMAAFVSAGQNVFLKINHLGDHPIEEAVNTHPALTGAVAELVREAGGNPVVGDCLDKAGFGPFETSGTRQMCEQLEIPLVNLREEEFVTIETPECTHLKTQLVPKRLVESDVVITLPKMKTHILCHYTGAVKNAYGFSPYQRRANYHKEHVSQYEFCEVVVDLFSSFVPRLAIMDAIVGMEGKGPSSGGDPRQVGVILASADCVALDTVATRIMGFGAGEVATNSIAAERGLGTTDMEKIQVRGELLEDVRIPDFKLPVNMVMLTNFLNRWPRPMLKVLRFFTNMMRELPKVRVDECIGCRLCENHCPEKAIVVKDKKALIDYEKCITCFCCQEFCQSDAIAVAHNLPGTVLVSLFAVYRRVKKLFRASH